MDHVLIDWVDEVEDLESLLLETLNERRLSDSGSGLTSDIVDILLSLLHSLDVVLQGDLVLTRLGGMESEEIGDLLSVGGILMDSKLEVL